MVAGRPLDNVRRPRTQIDGHTLELGVEATLCAFARTPDLFYCLEDVSTERNGQLGLVARTVDGTVTVVGRVAQQHRPAASGTPSLRLSLTPDGEGVSYSVGTARVQLLLVDGLATIPRP
jgi:hypothetical protein